MPKPEYYNTFSIRLPQSLVDQLSVRAKIAHRSRNAEIHFLLAKAIDVDVENDLELGRQIKRLNHPEDQSSG